MQASEQVKECLLQSDVFGPLPFPVGWAMNLPQGQSVWNAGERTARGKLCWLSFTLKATTPRAKGGPWDQFHHQNRKTLTKCFAFRKLTFITQPENYENIFPAMYQALLSWWFLMSKHTTSPPSPHSRYPEVWKQNPFSYITLRSAHWYSLYSSAIWQYLMTFFTCIRVNPGIRLLGNSPPNTITCTCACPAARSSPTLCNPMDYRPPASSVPVIFQTRILEWVAISYSSRSSWPRDRTWVSCIGRRILYHWATWEAQIQSHTHTKKKKKIL